MWMGLQSSTGGVPVGAERLAVLEANEITVVRIEAGPDPAAAAAEVMNAGLVPLVICKTAADVGALPPGCYAELGNEPDITANGWTAASYREAAHAAILALPAGVTLFLGAVSNLNDRGLAFLARLDWDVYPASVGCSHHWYPDGPPEQGHDGRTRDEEVAALVDIVNTGDVARPLLLSEVGYNNKTYPEDQVVSAFAFEREFWTGHGYVAAVAYQITDGPDPSQVEDTYGFHDVHGVWKEARVSAWSGVPWVDVGGPIEPGERVYEVPAWTSPDGLVTVSGITVTVRGVGPVDPDPGPGPIDPDPGPGPGPGPGTRYVEPILGWVRPAERATWGDDSGPRSLRFCSFFPLVRFFKDKPDWARAQLDAMIGRYHGVRMFWCLLHPQAWVPMQASVDPFAPWFEDAFRLTLEELWQRELRAQLTAGDLQYLPAGTDKRALYRRIAEQCKAVGQQVIGVTEIVNEARVNSDEKEDWAYWASLSKEWQSVYPWGMHGLSDPGGGQGGPEEPAELKAAAQAPATCALIHGTRQGLTDSIRRAFNVRYEGYRDKPILQGEPCGIDTGPSPGVYEGTDNHAHIFGLYAAIVLTGQALTHFDSAGLGWHHFEIDREWGFRELPELFHAMRIPDDIGLYDLTPGHRSNAPISVRSFVDPGGTGPARCDNMSARDGSRGYAILHGGKGAYQPIVRQDCGYRYWRWNGLAIEGRASAGASLPEIDSNVQAIVIEWEK